MAKPWKPRRAQAKTLPLVLKHPAFGALLDPGLGKTSVMLAALSMFQEQGVVRRALVIAPLRVCYDAWPEEAKEWRDFTHLRVSVLHGSKKHERLRDDADLFVINPEGLAWLSANAPRGWWPDMLVVDESTKFKHTNTQRFKTLRALLPRFTRRYILTGSPAPNGMQDLFGQVYILDFGEALGRFITHFRRRYFERTWDGYGWELREGAEEEIYEKLRHLVIRLDAEDYLDLPPIVKKKIAVDLPKKARKAYDRLANDLVLKLRSGEVTAVNAGVLTAKLRQIANGRIYYDPDVSDLVSKTRRVAQVHAAKLDALEDLVDELSGQPLLVAYEFKHDLEAIRSRFGQDLPAIGGGVSAKRGRELIREWNAGRLPLLPVHPASAGHGLNLQRGGNHLVWYGLTWNLEHHDQTIGRLWRQGQEQRVFVYYLVARGTTDVTVLNALDAKAKTQRDLFNALKRELT